MCVCVQGANTEEIVRSPSSVHDSLSMSTRLPRAGSGEGECGSDHAASGVDRGVRCTPRYYFGVGGGGTNP